MDIKKIYDYLIFKKISFNDLLKKDPIDVELDMALLEIWKENKPPKADMITELNNSLDRLQRVAELDVFRDENGRTITVTKLTTEKQEQK